MLKLAPFSKQRPAPDADAATKEAPSVRKPWADIRAGPALFLLAAIAISIGAIASLSLRRGAAIPSGFARANGRIEIERVDIAAKYAGRVVTIFIDEGDVVVRGAVIAQLDTTELDAQSAAARANISRAAETINRAVAEVRLRQAEYDLSKIELQRAEKLTLEEFTPQAELDRRKAQHDVADAGLRAARAAVRDAEAAKAAAEAQLAFLEATISEMTLKAPVSGRVEYKLVQAGAVLGAGDRAAAILDYSDAYMTVFLPTSDSGRVALGSEARIVLDAAPDAVMPAVVSFVAAEAQFTPKVVETEDEREKLMYRVKLSIDPTLFETHPDYVKAGLTGDAYLMVSRDAVWPPSLRASLPDEE